MVAFVIAVALFVGSPLFLLLGVTALAQGDGLDALVLLASSIGCAVIWSKALWRLAPSI